MIDELGLGAGPDDRALLEDALARVLPPSVEVEWPAARQPWTAHARLTTPGARCAELLLSPERAEARLEELGAVPLPRQGDAAARADLDRLARLVAAYLAGRTSLERTHGALGVRTSTVVTTSDGPWRFGRRGPTPPA